MKRHATTPLVIFLAIWCALLTIPAMAGDQYALFGQVNTSAGEPVAGVQVAFSGGLAAQETDAQGRYAVDGAVTGQAYTVTPSLAGWSFSPADRSVIISSGDEQVDFVAGQANSAPDKVSPPRVFYAASPEPMCVLSCDATGLSSASSLRAQPMTGSSGGQYRRGWPTEVTTAFA